jgi:hypothetical protein
MEFRRAAPGPALPEGDEGYRDRRRDDRQQRQAAAHEDAPVARPAVACEPKSP